MADLRALYGPGPVSGGPGDQRPQRHRRQGQRAGGPRAATGPSRPKPRRTWCTTSMVCTCRPAGYWSARRRSTTGATFVGTAEVRVPQVPYLVKRAFLLTPVPDPRATSLLASQPSSRRRIGSSGRGQRYQVPRHLTPDAIIRAAIGTSSHSLTFGVIAHNPSLVC